jgi:hypothetical protein
MKKVTLFLFTTLIFLGVTNYCIAQNKKSGTQKSISSIAKHNNELSQGKTFVLTKEGVGCLKKNMLVSKIPSNCSGLYDRFEKSTVEDDFNGNYTEYIFYSGTEKVVVTKDYGDGKIYYIDAYSPKVSIPDGVYPGMSIKKLLTLKGVKGNYNDGINLTFNGYTINIDNFEQLTAYGEKLFQDAYAKGTEVKLSNACFKEGAKIIFISNY